MQTMTVPDLPSIERPSLDDLSKVEIGKAVAGAATAVGLMPKRRSRWPFVLVAGVALAAAGWAWMNAEMLRRRASDARGWMSDQLALIRATGDERPAAFPSAEVAPSAGDDPNGFGAPADMDSTIGDEILTRDKVAARS